MKDSQGLRGLTQNPITLSSMWLLILGISCLTLVSPALAHHPMGGETPNNFMTGLLSGLGHPVIGIDHLVFVVALGLLAVLSNRYALMIPGSFVAATILGTVIQLQALDLPVVEVVISASVMLAGILLAKSKVSNINVLVSMVAIAGIFHGYAYGETIVGAETTALGAYLLGFALIQLVISFGVYTLGRSLFPVTNNTPNLPLRFAGFTIAGIGLAFLSNTILG